MATPTPRVTVVVPTRSRPDLLRRTLDRLAPGAQSIDAAEYEVVVSDDAKPMSAERDLGAAYRWTRVVEGPSRGPAANRNAGARAARGQWLAFTDDDTLPSRDWLSRFVAALRPGCHVYEGRTTCEGGFRSPLNHAPVNEAGGRLWSCNFMVSRDAFERVGGFDEGFPFPHMEDQDLRVRLEAAGFPLVFVRDAVVDHPPRRQPSGSRLGAYRASDVRYHVKHHRHPESRGALLRRVVRYRLGVIRDTPKSWASVVALGSLAREAAHVVRHVAEWERAALREFGVADAR